jgi:hypothetical protein
MAVRAIIVVALLASAAYAQEPAPAPATPADALRDGNAAAAQGDWAKVSSLVDPLLRGQLPPADLAEAHRLAGIAAFFQNRKQEAEQHFLAYLRIDLEGRLDPALYPPDVVNFFNDVRALNDAELRKRRPKQKNYWLLNLIPPGGQIQNGDKVKAYVIGGALGVFAIANVTSYLVLRSWCTEVSGDEGSSVTCDEGKDRSSSASTLRIVNIASGIGLILTYGYGVYDGIKGYRRNESPQPFVAPASGGGGVVGVFGRF